MIFSIPSFVEPLITLSFFIIDSFMILLFVINTGIILFSYGTLQKNPVPLLFSFFIFIIEFAI